MPKKGNAWMIPANIAPTERRCVLLYIPDDIEWIANFWGALLPLSQWMNWERDDGHSGTLVASVWREVVSDAWERFLNEECCPAIPPPEPPSPPPLPPGLPDSGFIGAGSRTGLSLEELEDFFMSWTLRGQLAWVNGKLSYWSEGCCDWVEVPTEAGSNPYVGSTSAADLGLDAWVGAGKPPVAPLEIPHDNPFYTTHESLKCAKATAIVNEFWNVISGFRQLAEELPEGALSLSGFVGFFVAFPPLSVLAAGVASGLATFGVWSKAATADWITRLSHVEGLLEEKNALICDLVPRMATPVQIGLLIANQLTPDDISIALDRFDAMIDDHPSVRELLGVFSVKGWQEVVVPKIANTDCACEEFLPYGYAPPVVAGAINFERFMGIGGTLPAPTYPSGQPFDQFDNLPKLGSPVGATGFKTQFRGLNSTTYHQAFAILLHSEEEITLQSVKMTVDAVNSPGTGQLKFNVRVYDANGWQAAGGGQQIVNNTNDQTLEIVNLNNVGNYIYISLEGLVVSASTHYEQVADILFTGQVGGVGFLERGIGQALVP